MLRPETAYVEVSLRVLRDTLKLSPKDRRQLRKYTAAAAAMWEAELLALAHHVTVIELLDQHRNNH